MPYVDWEIVNQTMSPDVIANTSASMYLVYDWHLSNIITTCAIVIAACLVYLVAADIRRKWREHWK